jgi:hypothetical protein
MRLSAVVAAVGLLAIAAAVQTGAARPAAPLFAYLHDVPRARYEKLHLVDPQTGVHMGRGRVEKRGAAYWTQDGRGVVVPLAQLRGEDGVYTLDDGWRIVEVDDAPGTSPLPHQPQDYHLMAQLNGTNDWNVLLMDTATREDTPIAPLQRLYSNPMLVWAPDERHVFAVLQDADAMRTGVVDLQAQTLTITNIYPAGSRYEREFYSPDGSYAAMVWGDGNGNTELHLIHLATGHTRVIERGIMVVDVVGFRPEAGE